MPNGDKMSDKRFVSYRTLSRSRKSIEDIKVPEGRQSMEFDIPEPTSKRA